ncbi:PREDICTED: MLO-like protein 3 [Tarenaya hassleriana]|uniref:MLO-like protein 3 n=1 Tax=Tarenaya hassleriana TaxID=28532 RepID=UPI00053C850E|nr:PREDICTED: MLO-like protein 3 [Tarenaya hassleriana]
MAINEGGFKSTTVGAARSLQETPTWALATVILVFVAVSILLEHLIHLLSIGLRKHRKTSLLESTEKLKSVLMVLGFMSLILTVIQGPVSKICVPTKYANRMLPCHRIKLSTRDDPASGQCSSKKNTPVISREGLNQLSFFIFVLAAMQIVFSLATMGLGRAKMRRWESWEKETQTVEYLAANDPNRFRITRQTTFARRHLSSCTQTSFQLWIKCFLRQFFHSVAKVDYLTLRHGFISAHLSSNNAFNFQKYIQRSLDDDFKAVVGITPLMWLTVVVFMLLDVHGWQIYLWMSFVPLIIVLVVGTKLEVIVAKMALQIKEQSHVIKGSPLVEPNDTHFWFRHPRFVLTLLHYTLFLNTFEMSFFLWVTWQFGLKSCYHEHTEFIVTRVVLAVTVQVLCSYITLIMAGDILMGSSYKSAILEEQIARALRQWHDRVRDKRKDQKKHNKLDVDNSNNNNSSSSSNNIDSNKQPGRSKQDREGGEIVEEEAGEMVDDGDIELGSSINHPSN